MDFFLTDKDKSELLAMIASKVGKEVMEEHERKSPQIEWGQYKGAGSDVYGENKKNNINLSFRPKIILIFCSYAWAAIVLPHNSSKGRYYAQLSNTDGSVEFYDNDTVKLGSNDVSQYVIYWHSNIDAQHQLSSGVWHDWIAIG